MRVRDRRLCRLTTLAMALLCLAIVAGSASAATDLKTILSIRNDSGEPLKCVILYGHWITTDIPEIAPGKIQSVDIMRAMKDGALYIPRFDGRHMMIERIACGRVDSWWESSGDIPLLPLRETGVAMSETRCHLATRADCSTPQPASK